MNLLQLLLLFSFLLFFLPQNIHSLKQIMSLPTLYEYYTNDGIKTGLEANGTFFKLNGKEITLYSGAIHYFRVPQSYWRDRLRKLKAAGLNCVETYIPWNLHEPQIGVFDFGQGGTDFEQFLNLELFIQTAKEEDLFVIIRPGPYICAEWEFGGLPSWLLNTKIQENNKLKIRTSNEAFMKHVKRYFNKLFAIIFPLQFTKGGPIIAFQIENEYGNVKEEGKVIDKDYLIELKNIFEECGLVELFFTSDTPSNGDFGAIEGILNTANFQDNATEELNILKKTQPDKPLMVMEYWTGWFDHWGEKHHTRSLELFTKELKQILTFPSSVNFYMFHGGTSWGFLNGANFDLKPGRGYEADINCYDYDAPLTEAGDYTKKYFALKKLITEHNNIKTKLPNLPEETKKIKYENIKITHQLNLCELLNSLKSNSFINQDLNLSMEDFPINNNNGQSYGYIIYSKNNLNITKNSFLTIEGEIRDSVIVILNGKQITKPLTNIKDVNDSFGYWKSNNSLKLSFENKEDLINATLILLVENWGRVNYGKLSIFPLQRKGIIGNVLLNNVDMLTEWDITPLEFKSSFFNSNLLKWDEFDDENFIQVPALYKATLEVDSHEIKDTFIDMRKWIKGFVAINGFVLSRYFNLGPQQSIYLPGAFLKEGKNEIVVFENYEPYPQLEFSSNIIFENL